MRLNRLPFTAAGLLAAISCLAASAVITAGTRAGDTLPPAAAPKVEAAALMARALSSIKALRLEKGIPLDAGLDPNGTGIVGDEFSPLTTSLGDAAAKRTAANPAFAGVVAGYYQRAGLGPGDVVAIGGSGSFPAFVLASLCAARALDLKPVLI